MKYHADELLTLVIWLKGQPSLEELQKRFPEHWAVVEEQLEKSIREKDHRRLDNLIRPLNAFSLQNEKKNKLINKKEAREFMGRLVRQRMAAIAIERFMKTALNEGKVRNLGNLDRILMRCLFFTKDYRRKLISNRMFCLLWPLVRRPNLLLPLAEAHGIYCFYSKAFIGGLTALIDGRKCIEIAAGDGALAGFLRKGGLEISAFDDHSWRGKINYGSDVVKLDAQSALRKCNPEVVVCCWPPAMNDFERHVFVTDTVQRYIVIGSEHRFSFGNWPVYSAQNTFTMHKDHGLSACLLPPDFGGAVYLFDRRR